MLLYSTISDKIGTYVVEILQKWTNGRYKTLDRIAGGCERTFKYLCPYITEIAVTFEYTVPAVEELNERIRQTLNLAAVQNGSIVRYVYVGPLHPGAAYAW